MKKYFYSELSSLDIKKLCSRQNLDLEKTKKICEDIESQILKNGDTAIFELTKKFDGASIDSFLVEEKNFLEAENLVNDELKKSIKKAAKNIEKFHKSQILEKQKIETSEGIFCWRESRAIGKVGLYIPGGTAPLFSTILMAVIPAKIAGCEKIILCTPPDKNGQVAPEILWTSKFLGIKEIYRVGGAQAIFGMAYGTKQIPQVDKIFGPGNQFVTMAKMMVSQTVAIDMPAGPSEALVISDKNSNPEYLAADVLSQAEHGSDSQSVLVTTDEDQADQVLLAIEKQKKTLNRNNFLDDSLAKSFIVITKNLDEAINFSNEYSPEHLILNFSDWKKYTPSIKNAGSVFCGPYSAESFGDYASGTNHILPTSGFAKNFSGVSVDSFIKKITFQEITKSGFDNLAPDVKNIAHAEQLMAHKNAVIVRE